MPSCPLCRSVAVKHLDSVCVSDLAHIYHRAYGINVAKFFGGSEISLLLCDSCDLRFYHPLVTGDVEFYEELSVHEDYYMDDKPEFTFAKALISANDIVLEIGGGHGAFGKSLATQNYTGLEFNRSAVAKAEQKGVRMANESVKEHAQHNRERYDVVCSFQVLEHVSDPRDFLEAAMHCLKPGGVLIISVPSYDSFLRTAPNLVSNMPPHHVTLWSDRALFNIADILGARVTSMQHERIAPYHFSWFVQCAIYSLLRRRSARRPALVDFGWRTRFLWKLSLLFTRMLQPLFALLKPRLPDEYLPTGHTVTVVLRKTQ